MKKHIAPLLIVASLSVAFVDRTLLGSNWRLPMSEMPEIEIDDDIRTSAEQIGNGSMVLSYLLISEGELDVYRRSVCPQVSSQ